MDGKSRIRLAFNHKEADRVPLFEAAFSNKLASEILGRKVYLPSNGGGSFRHFLQAHQEGYDQVVREAEKASQAAIELYAHLGIDMIRVRITDFLTPVDFGYGNYGANFLFDCEIQEQGENLWRIIGDEGFWSKHIYEPDTDAIMCVDHALMHGGVEEFRRWVNFLEARPTDIPPQAEAGLAGVRKAVKLGREKGVFVLGWGDVAYPGSSPYLSLFLMLMMTEPELIQRYMEVTTAGALSFVKTQIEAGVDGIIGGNDWCFKSGPMFSPREFRRFFVPYLRQIAEMCHQNGIPYIKHLDGNTKKLLDILVDEVGIDGHHPFEPSAGMDLVDAKKQYGDRLTLMGNLECGWLLSEGTPEQVRLAARVLLKHVAPGGGYIFSSSNSIHDGVRLENLYAMLETVQQEGVYPIRL